MSNNQNLPDINQIQQLIPHRYPFLLVDKVISLDFENRKIVATKNVSINEPFFQGHFPAHAVMPGVLVIESMAQAGGLLSHMTRGGADAGKISYLVKVDGAKFSRMVVPGDRLELEVEIKREIRNMTLYTCNATVDGQQVACAEILCAEVDA